MECLPEELDDRGYVYLEQMEHANIMPFISVYLKKKTTAVSLFNMSLIVGVCCLAGWFWFCVAYLHLSFSNCLTYLSYGMALAFILVPLHEFIHVLAYKKLGAKQTAYEVHLKRFYFLAIADLFVANKKEFFLVALAPLTLITSGLLLLLLFTGPLWSCTIIGTILTHGLMASGDIALISFFQFHNRLEIVTYDDRAKQVTYFYSKAREEG